jgi:hypothetical protein
MLDSSLKLTDFVVLVEIVVVVRRAVSNITESQVDGPRGGTTLKERRKAELTSIFFASSFSVRSLSDCSTRILIARVFG